MSHATLDRVLAGLVVALAASGLLSLRAGAADEAWIFVVHSVLGGALAAATVVKLWRSVPRAVAAGRWRRLAVSLVVSLATIAALTGGFLWVASGSIVSIGSWTVLTIHAWVGLVLVPLVVLHLLPRRWRVLRPPRRTNAALPGVSRRTVLATGLLGLTGLATFGATRTVEALRGGSRRFTGSRFLPAGGVPPPTTFFGEGAPAIDPDAWRLAVHASDGARRDWSLADLRAIGETELTAILDCTSGWALETAWRGVPLRAVLDEPPSGPVLVRSATGWSTLLSPTDIDRAFLATGVAGDDLPVANGAPCRLVVPDRRGLDWVKWVQEIQPA